MVFLEANYTNRPSGSGIEMITDTIRRNARVMHISGKQAPVLQFPIEVVFDEPVDIFVFTQVKDWLLSSTDFKQLQICAEYFNTFYFNCYIESDEDLVYNGGYRGLRGTVICDAPWAWEFETTMTYEINKTPYNFRFNNLSADTELLKPIIEITSGGGDVSIINQTTGKTTSFTALSAGEVVTLDNQYAVLTSSIGANRLPNFNKIFLKFAKGMNDIQVTGKITQLVIKYENAKRIGGAYY